MILRREQTGEENGLGALISERAAFLGFDYCGFAPAGAAAETARRYSDWLDRGRHGTMDWMANTRSLRLDPSKILPGAKSVVCVALNYYTEPAPSDSPECGKISRYARFRDYHKVLRSKLYKLLGEIREHRPDVSGAVCVDSKPVLEKAYAQAAGIGWIGKNTCLLTKRLGSYVFLGELILDAELPYGKPHADHCGSCTRCLDACPTGALVEPHALDARRCISYLTIETRSPVPDELAGKSGAWIFGCDVCQEVCPWNDRKARSAIEPDFEPREDLLAPKLSALQHALEGSDGPAGSEEFELARARFAKIFAGTPVMRAGAKRMAESVRRAASNAPSPAQTRSGVGGR